MGLDNPLHIIFLVVVLLLVFGARRLPEIGRSLGTGMREFKQSVTGESSNASHEHQQQTLPPAQTQASAQTQTPAQAQPPAQTQPPAQAQPPAQTQSAAQEAFAQRDPASTEQR